jgi:hypothetical protein
MRVGSATVTRRRIGSPSASPTARSTTSLFPPARARAKPSIVFRFGNASSCSRGSFHRFALLNTISGDFLATLVKASPAQIQSTIKGLITAARKALSGKTESRIVALLRKDNAKLKGLAKKRDELLQRIQDAADLKKSVAESVTPDITSAPKSAPGIRRFLAKQLDTLKRFRANLKKLAKRGLPKVLLEQLIRAGLDGAATAQALVNANAADFASIKKLATDIGAQAAGLGEDSAIALYGAGVDASKGLINGLKSQVGAIESQMTAIGKAMVKALKKALGMKSPSRPGRAIGRNFVDSIVLGADDRTPALNAKFAAVARIPQGPTAAARAAAASAANRGGAFDGVEITNHNYYPRPPIEQATIALRKAAFLVGGAS